MMRGGWECLRVFTTKNCVTFTKQSMFFMREETKFFFFLLIYIAYLQSAHGCKE
jgi:hypothetical protein